MKDSLKREPMFDVIEQAMNRHAQGSPEKVVADGIKGRENLDLGRWDYDMALVKRPDEHRIPPQGAHGVPPVLQPPVTSDSPPLRPCGFRTGTVLVAMLLSMAAGAAATWLVVSADRQQVAASAPISPIAPVVLSAPIAQIAIPDRPEVVEAAAVAPAPRSSSEDRVRELVEKWRAAWAGRDVDAYLACYSADFTPANGQSRAAWEAGRRRNIASRGSIDVATTDLTIEPMGTRRVMVRFLQDYASGNYRETAQPKTLLLVRGEAGWRIAGEWQGESPQAQSANPEHQETTVAM